MAVILRLASEPFNLSLARATYWIAQAQYKQLMWRGTHWSWYLMLRSTNSASSASHLTGVVSAVG